jgi:phosphohistidine phosphatase
MRQLMLLRHAKTERESPSGSDRDRSLNARGLNDSPAIGRYIASHKLVPQLVLVSPAVRARQTWELLAEELAHVPPAEIVHDLYGADATQLLHIARIAKSLAPRVAAKRLMIVAHNPGLQEFALALTRTGEARARQMLADNLPTSGLAIIDFEIDDWEALAFRQGRLERLVSPALLREKSEES